MAERHGAEAEQPRRGLAELYNRPGKNCDGTTRIAAKYPECVAIVAAWLP